MSTERFPAAVISASPAVPTLASAQGVWSREQQFQAQQQGIWPVNPNLADPYFKYVTLLLHGDGTNGAQNNTFIDSSANNFTITRNGNTTQGSFSPFGTLWSNYFDGTGDYLIPAASAPFALSTGDFTIEGWFFPASASTTQGIMGCGPGAANSWEVFVNYPSNAGKVTFNVYGSTSYHSAGTFTANTWNHFAVVRSGGTLKVYLNGIGNTGVANSTNFTVTDLVIGRTYYNLSQEHFQGNISNIRIVKSAVYTTDFTPPTSPLTAITNTVLLTCQSNRFVDNSSTGAAITRNGDVTVSRFSPFSPSVPYATSTIGGSAIFDGTGDYLNAGTNAAFGFGTGTYTVEFWVFPNSLANIHAYVRNNTTGGWQVYWDTTNGISVGAVGSASLFTAGSTSLTVGQWQHVAVCRNSTSANDTRIFVNGVLKGTGTDATNWTVTGALTFGADSSGTTAFSGYMSNARMLKGTALYTTGFTPPTAPLTAITNTSILLSTINGAIFDNAMTNDLETAGTAQISTSVVKYGTGSIFINSTGNKLVFPVNSQSVAFGAGDFTVEAWVYRTVVGVTQVLLSGQGDGASVAGSSFVCYLSGTSNSDLYIGSTGYSAASPNPSLNTWAHVAYVRNGTSWKTYLNGVQVGSATLPAGGFVNAGSTTYLTQVGSTGNNSSPLTGYIDELRITKGYARYTANFTPPPAPFSNQ